MKPEELSRQLRKGTGKFLARRRGMVGTSLVAAGSMALITLYQSGIIEHLPEPPLPYFDADKVDAAPEAYSMFSMPDAAIGLGNYAATLALAVMAGENRAEDRPWIPLALTAKTFVDAFQAGKLSVSQWTQHRAFCFWCLLAAGATFVAAPLTLPEARTASEKVRQ